MDRDTGIMRMVQKRKQNIRKKNQLVTKNTIPYKLDELNTLTISENLKRIQYLLYITLLNKIIKMFFMVKNKIKDV